MTEVDVLQAIAAKVESDWTEDAAVIFPGQRAEPPAAGAYVIVRVRYDLPAVSVTHGARGQRQAQRRGLLIAEVYAPTATVDSSFPALALADAFRALFQGLDVPDSPGVEPINFEDATLSAVGNVPGGAHYQVNATCPFTFPATF